MIIFKKNIARIPTCGTSNQKEDPPPLPLPCCCCSRASYATSLSNVAAGASEGRGPRAEPSRVGLQTSEVKEASPLLKAARFKGL